MDEQSGRQCRELASVRNWECSRWTATIVWMRVCASAPYRTDRVGRTRSAANGERALLSKLLIFFHSGQARCRETIQGVLGAEPLVHKDDDGRATRQPCPGCMATKRQPSNAVQNLRDGASRSSASD